MAQDTCLGMAPMPVMVVVSPLIRGLIQLAHPEGLLSAFLAEMETRSPWALLTSSWQSALQMFSGCGGCGVVGVWVLGRVAHLRSQVPKVVVQKAASAVSSGLPLCGAGPGTPEQWSWE